MKTIIDNVKIRAIASWLPEEILELRTLSVLYGEQDVETIIRTTGIERVRVASEGMTSSDMCFKAAEYLLEKESFDRSKIDGLVFVSQTTDHILPSTSIGLQDRLGLKKECVCIDVHYGCSGYIYGLLQGACWINSGLCRNVIVLAGDTTTRMINHMDKSLRMVFGDCGTATLMNMGHSSMGFNIMSDGSGAKSLIVPAGGFRVPKSEKTSVLEFDSEGNGRSLNDLYMDGMSIFNFAIFKVPKLINETIDMMGWQKEDVSIYLLHQANDFMVGYLRKKLKVQPSLVPTNSKDYGNTGPGTIPLLCSDFLSDYRGDLSKTIMCGFGVGLSWGSVALNLNGTNFYSPINK